MIILGFGHKARNGKDTAVAAIAEYFGAKRGTQARHSLPPASPVVKTLKFADALYEEVNTWLKYTTADGTVQYDELGSYVVPPDITNGLVFVEIPRWVKPDPKPEILPNAPYGKHPKLLQWWGTEYRRARDANYWANKLVQNVRASNADIVLISDMRFINETEAIKSLGGYTINVTRRNSDGTQYIDPSRPSDHVSETQLDGFNYDFRLDNPNGHQALLAEQSVTLVEYLRGLEQK